MAKKLGRGILEWAAGGAGSSSSVASSGRGFERRRRSSTRASDSLSGSTSSTAATRSSSVSGPHIEHLAEEASKAPLPATSMVPEARSMARSNVRPPITGYVRCIDHDRKTRYYLLARRPADKRQDQQLGSADVLFELPAAEVEFPISSDVVATDPPTSTELCAPVICDMAQFSADPSWYPFDPFAPRQFHDSEHSSNTDKKASNVTTTKSQGVQTVDIDASKVSKVNITSGKKSNSKPKATASASVATVSSPDAIANVKGGAIDAISGIGVQASDQAPSPKPPTSGGLASENAETIANGMVKKVIASADGKQGSTQQPTDKQEGDASAAVWNNIVEPQSSGDQGAGEGAKNAHQCSTANGVAVSEDNTGSVSKSQAGDDKARNLTVPVANGKILDAPINAEQNTSSTLVAPDGGIAPDWPSQVPQKATKEEEDLSGKRMLMMRTDLHLSWQQIANLFEESIDTCIARYINLIEEGQARPPVRHNGVWTSEEKQDLARMTTSEGHDKLYIACCLGRSVREVSEIQKQIGLQQSTPNISSPGVKQAEMSQNGTEEAKADTGNVNWGEGVWECSEETGKQECEW